MRQRLFLFGAILLLSSLLRAPAPQSSSPPPDSSETRQDRQQIREIEGALPKFADRGATLFYLAQLYAHVGDLSKSLSLLKECMARDAGFDPRTPDFQALESNPEFQKMVSLARKRYPPLHRARVAFTVVQPDLFPEGIAVDAAKRIFYLGSEYRKQIISVGGSGQASDFVKANLYDLMPVGGVHVDPADHSVWAATDGGVKHRPELVHFDERGTLLERYPLGRAGTHDLNDFVLHNAREIFATDTEGNQVYRFDRDKHTFTPLSFPRPIFLPNGITQSADGRWLYVADMMGVFRVDLAHNSAIEVDPGEHSSLSGIDGLYWYQGSLVGVEYGTGPYRVARWKLSADGLKVVSTEIFERGTSLVSDPTTGAIFGEKFYFIANTGIYNLKHWEIVDPKKLEPVHVAVVPLN